MGFKQRHADPCVFTKYKEKQSTFVAVNVDNLVIVSKCYSALSPFKTKILLIFDLKELRPMKTLRDINVQYD